MASAQHRMHLTDTPRWRQFQDSTIFDAKRQSVRNHAKDVTIGDSGPQPCTDPGGG